MTSLVWTGVALWFGFNVAVVARRVYVTRPCRNPVTSGRVHTSGYTQFSQV
jgi:hypothetical protein